LLWHRVSCTGELPGPRYGHTAHIIGSRMFVFGGKGPKDVVYKDVYFLDLVEWVWVPVNSISLPPPARFFHASEVVGRKIVLHGGWDGEEVFNDLWIFNTESFVWMQPRTAGFGPSPRYGHTLTLTVDGRLLVFGGCFINEETGVPKYLDDVRQLNTDNMVWSRPRMNGESPTGRYGHSATLLNNGKILYFGGWGRGGCQSKEVQEGSNAHSIHVLDTITMSWHAPRRGTHKQVRHLYNHSSCRAGPNDVFVFGGYDGRQACSDFVSIHLESPETNG
jgi:N-acetylneuraminic acid mutarotase